VEAARGVKASPIRTTRNRKSAERLPHPDPAHKCFASGARRRRTRVDAGDEHSLNGVERSYNALWIAVSLTAGNVA
jgi:hypothetical protein